MKKAIMKKKTKTPKVKLSANAKRVLDWLEGETNCDNSDSFFKEYGLLEDTDKPYYMFCYWESGSNGGFCDEADIRDTLGTIIKNGYDDNYSFTLFDVKNDCEVEVEIEDIKFKLVAWGSPQFC